MENTWEEEEDSTQRLELGGTGGTHTASGSPVGRHFEVPETWEELHDQWVKITQRLQDREFLANTDANDEPECTCSYYINSGTDGLDDYWRSVYEEEDDENLAMEGRDYWENPFSGDREFDAEAYRRQQLKARALAHISKMFAEAEAGGQESDDEQAEKVLGASGLRPIKLQGVGMIHLGRHLDLASVAAKLEFHGLTLLSRPQRELPFPLHTLHKKRIRKQEEERGDPSLRARSGDTPVAFVIHSSGMVMLKGARSAAQTQRATREIVTILGDARSNPELTVVRLDRGYRTGFPVAVDKLGDILREQHILGLGRVVHDWVKLVTIPCAFPFRLKSQSGANITVTTYENGAVTVSGGTTEDESTVAFERIYPFILQCRRHSRGWTTPR